MINKRIILSGIIVILIIIGLIHPFKEKWSEGWELDKEKICLPYNLDGIVKVYEGTEHCTIEEIKEKEEFQDYYCNLYSCKPVLKSQKRVKEIYEEFARCEDGEE